MFTDNSSGGGAQGFFNVNQQQQRPQYATTQQSMGAPDGAASSYGAGSQRRPGMSMEPRKSKVFTPVTVRMIMNSQPRPDDICEFDGDPINDIILVGRLLRRVEEPMRTQFEINDNTGTFHILFYHKGENQVPTALRNFNYDQFCYAKVYGNIRVFKEEKAIVGTHIKRIEKFDEMTNHFLSTYVAHCIRKKGVLKPRELAMDHNQANQISDISNQGGNSGNQGNQMIVDQTARQMYPQNNSGSAQNFNADRQAAKGPSAGNFTSPDELRQAILQLMRELSKQKKMIHKNEVFSLLQERTDAESFEKELTRLQDDGDICQSFDHNHFCLVE